MGGCNYYYYYYYYYMVSLVDMLDLPVSTTEIDVWYGFAWSNTKRTTTLKH